MIITTKAHLDELLVLAVLVGITLTIGVALITTSLRRSHRRQ